MSQEAYEPEFLLNFFFENKYSNHPIQGSADNVQGISYGTHRNGWIDGHQFIQWLGEPRAIQKLPNCQQRILFIDNFSGHMSTMEVKEALENLKYL